MAASCGSLAWGKLPGRTQKFTPGAVRDTLAWFAEAGMLEEPFTAPEASPAS